MYKHTAPAPASGLAGESQSVNNNPIATFISNNKMVALHLAYILLLAFIGRHFRPYNKILTSFTFTRPIKFCLASKMAPEKRLGQ